MASEAAKRVIDQAKQEAGGEASKIIEEERTHSAP